MRRKEINESEKTADVLCGGTKATLRNYVLNKVNDSYLNSRIQNISR